MNRMNFQPQATPTNKAYRPEVRAGSGGDQLAQLAAALAPLSKSVGQVSQFLVEASIRNSVEQGQQFVAQKQIQNQKQFKELVDKGEVPLSGNPWFLYGVDSTVAGLEVDKASRDLVDEYSRSGLINKEAPEVESFIDNFYSTNLQIASRNPDELRVMQERMQQTKDRLLRSHINARSDERLKEFALAAETELQGIFSGPNMEGDLSRFMSEKSKYLPWSDLNNLVATSAYAYADNKDPAAYKKILSQIKVGNGTLYDNPSFQAREGDLFIKAMERDKRLHEYEKWQKGQGRQVIVDQFVAGMGEKLAKVRKQNPNAHFMDLGVSAADILTMPGWDAETKEATLAEMSRWQKAIDGDQKALAEAAADESARDFVTKLGEWNKSHPGELPLPLILDSFNKALAGGAGASEFNLLQNFVSGVGATMRDNRQDNSVYATLKHKASVEKNLTSQEVFANVGSLTSAQVDDLFTTIGVNQKVKNDPVKGVEGLSTREARIVGDRIRNGLARRAESSPSFAELKASGFNDGLVAQIESAAQRGEAEYMQMFESDSGSLEHPTYADYAKLSDDIAERVTVKYNGLNKTDYDQWTGLRPATDSKKPGDTATSSISSDKPTDAKGSTLRATGPQYPLSHSEVLSLNKLLKQPTIDSKQQLPALLNDLDVVFPSAVNLMNNSPAAGQKHVLNSTDRLLERERLATIIASPEFKQMLKTSMSAAETEVAAAGGISSETKSTLIALHNMLYQNDFYSHAFGFRFQDVAEVPDGWKRYSLFASPDDIRSTNPIKQRRVAQYIKDLKAPGNEFVRYQLLLSAQTESNRRTWINDVER